MTLRTGRRQRGRATYRYYTCSTKARQGKTGCKGRTILMDKLDHLVADHLESRLLQPKRLETVFVSVIDRRQERTERRREHLAELHRCIAELLRALVAASSGKLATFGVQSSVLKWRGNPSEDRKLDREAITVKELCTRYLADLNRGLILGKRGRPKKTTTIVSDTGRIQRHLIPLLGGRRVRDLTKAEITQTMKDIMAGKTRVNVKTEKRRGRAIVRGGVGTATRTIGLLGGILSYAVELGVIEHNLAHGLRKPKDNVKDRRLSEQEYRTLGDILRKVAEDGRYATAANMIRVIALTGCRRNEIINLRWDEIDTAGSCLRLADSKEGASVRPIGLSVLEYFEGGRAGDAEGYVFPGWAEGKPFGSFPNHWTKILGETGLADITPHVLRHSFASIANDLGFTEATIATLLGHSRGTVTSRYIHTVDTAIVMAADNIAGYIQGLLDGVTFTHTSYALDQVSRKASLTHFLGKTKPTKSNAEHTAL